jgi:hypothetical protein
LAAGRRAAGGWRLAANGFFVLTLLQPQIDAQLGRPLHPAANGRINAQSSKAIRHRAIYCMWHRAT